MAPIRRAGRARILDGSWIVWSEAEGSHGTRWRESIESEGGVARVTLLEATPADRLSRLEVAGPAGLLTLHPERGRVGAPRQPRRGADGVRHFAPPMEPRPRAAAAAFARLGDGHPAPVVGARRGRGKPDGRCRSDRRSSGSATRKLDVRAQRLIASGGSAPRMGARSGSCVSILPGGRSCQRPSNGRSRRDCG